MAESKEFKVSSEYTYKYREDNGLGTLVVKKGGITYPASDIRVFRIQNENQRDAIKIKHPNYLRVLVWDNLRDNLVCDQPGTPLRKYLSEWIGGGVGRSMIMRYKTKGKREGKEDIWINYLAEVARDVIRQLYKFVYDLHKLKHCLMDFTIDNICMNGTIAQIVVVGVLPSDTHARKNDFSNIAELIEEIMKMRNPDEWEHDDKDQLIPSTISDLIDKIKSLKCEDENDGELYEEKLLINHLALVPASVTVNFVKTAFQLLVNDKHNAKNVYGRLVNFENWNSRFGLIGEEYVYKYYNNPEVRQYDQTGDTEIVMSSLLRFARNLAFHINVKGDIIVEAVIMTMFSREILAIQRSLEEDNVLLLSSFMPCL